jgi:hypothetical protein
MPRVNDKGAQRRVPRVRPEPPAPVRPAAAPNRAGQTHFDPRTAAPTLAQAAGAPTSPRAVSQRGLGFEVLDAQPACAPTSLDGRLVVLSGYRADEAVRRRGLAYLESRAGGSDATAEMKRRALAAQAGHLAFAAVPVEELMLTAAYISDQFIPMNAALRAPEADPTGDLAAAIGCVASALGRLPPFQGTVYRALGGSDPARLEAYQPGAVLTEKAFTSTTPSDAAAWRFGKVMLVIDAKHAGKEIWPLAGNMNRGEQEVLFPPGTRFEVKSREENERGKLVIHLAEVTP